MEGHVLAPIRAAVGNNNTRGRNVTLVSISVTQVYCTSLYQRVRDAKVKYIHWLSLRFLFWYTHLTITNAPILNDRQFINASNYYQYTCKACDYTFLNVCIDSYIDNSSNDSSVGYLLKGFHCVIDRSHSSSNGQ